MVYETNGNDNLSDNINMYLLRAEPMRENVLSLGNTEGGVGGIYNHKYYGYGVYNMYTGIVGAQNFLNNNQLSYIEMGKLCMTNVKK